MKQAYSFSFECSFIYPWSAPVEFGEDAPAQSVYGLQHFGSEFWELRCLEDTQQHHHNMAVTTTEL